MKYHEEVPSKRFLANIRSQEGLVRIMENRDEFVTFVIACDRCHMAYHVTYEEIDMDKTIRIFPFWFKFYGF